MTNEQIIIHDVNVAECEYHSFNKFGHILCDLENNPIVRSQGRLCEQNPICPYKVRYDLIQKLKRKEQECEEWKHQAELGSDTTDILTKQLEEKEQGIDECREKFHKQFNQLKAENEELREKIKAYDEVYSNHDVLNERNNYKQALQEIKRLVKKDYCSEIESCEFCAEIGNCINRKILQKCEVLKDVK